MFKKNIDVIKQKLWQCLSEGTKENILLLKECSIKVKNKFRKCWKRNKFWGLSLIVLLGVFLLPAIVTKCTAYVDFFGLASNPNEIGDIIGGILSPFIGLVSAVLVYITIKEQIKANSLIQKQFKKEKKSKFEEIIFSEILKQLGELEKEMNSFNWRDINGVLISRSNISQHLMKMILFYDFRKFTIYIDQNGSTKPVEVKVGQDVFGEYMGIFRKYIDILDLYSDNIIGHKAYSVIIKNWIVKFLPFFSMNPPISDLREGVTNLWKVGEFLKMDSYDLGLIYKYYDILNSINTNLSKSQQIPFLNKDFYKFLDSEFENFRIIIDNPKTTKEAMQPKRMGWHVLSRDQKEKYIERVHASQNELKTALSRMKGSNIYKFENTSELEFLANLEHFHLPL